MSIPELDVVAADFLSATPLMEAGARASIGNFTQAGLEHELRHPKASPRIAVRGTDVIGACTPDAHRSVVEQPDELRDPGRWRLRSARVEDAPAIAALFQAVYRESSQHPCSRPDHVSSLIADGRYQMVVAARSGDIVGCCAADQTAVPGVFEICSLVVRPGARLRGLARRLYRTVLARILATPDCEWVVGMPRSATTYRLTKIEPLLGMLSYGHDGGMHVPNGARECHLVACAPNPGVRIRRARPARAIAAVERRLTDTAIVTVSAPSPRAWCVPPPSGVSVGASRCLPVPARRSTLARVLAGVDAAIAERNAQDHWFAYVPMARIGFLHGLAERGFRATAYLPAWHREGNVRHDCLLMVRYTGTDRPRTNGLARCMSAWDRLLAGVARGRMLPSVRMVGEGGLTRCVDETA